MRPMDDREGRDATDGRGRRSAGRTIPGDTSDGRGRRSGGTIAGWEDCGAGKSWTDRRGEVEGSYQRDRAPWEEALCASGMGLKKSTISQIG
jgi:hypothetical protein